MFGSDWWRGYGPWVVFFVGICVAGVLFGWPTPDNHDPFGP